MCHFTDLERNAPSLLICQTVVETHLLREASLIDLLSPEGGTEK